MKQFLVFCTRTEQLSWEHEIAASQTISALEDIKVWQLEVKGSPIDSNSQGVKLREVDWSYHV